MASGGSTTRWCPTPEQVMLLEEMYRSGVRTPNAAQIQQITGQLSCYGRIEGKNVFYWFQNHKARERQKLRRRLSRHYHHLLYCQRSSFFNNPPPLITAHHALQHYHTAPPPSIFLNSQEVNAEATNFGCCRAPLKTLDLFPTKSSSSAGAEEEEPKAATVPLMAQPQGISLVNRGEAR
ncbi:WUSCHEL-related homeobox 3-like [Zingiber officinale]|uniref:Homeobox domain-containing protein n=1 Tax=Zingiber officinale TaxID=94328 RepID=A0A8J5HLL6_ZINOF|nr:WUSCHEL-related homeobox 3-like [Zingiber officinale]KAG6531018.1 hypothetical protein ZIOFF_004788 [Zingiber officinale]